MISSIRFLLLVIFFLNSPLLFKNLIPLEEPPQLGLDKTGNILLFLYEISFGDKILSFFLR